MTTSWPIYLACLLYLCTTSLGATVQYAHVRLGDWRKAHHLLYASTWISVIGALGLGLWWQTPWWWAPGLIIPILSLFPVWRAHSAMHRRLALSGIIIWNIILGLMLIVS